MLPAVPSTTVPPAFSLYSTLSYWYLRICTTVYAQSTFLCIPDNTQCGAILHATTGVLELSLADNVASCFL